MKTKTIMITGANSGIGYQTALGLAYKKHHVVMICRNAERGQLAQEKIIAETGHADVDLIIMDLSSQHSIREGVADFNARYEHLDVLINNASIFDITQKHIKLSNDGIETIFATNHLGAFLLTQLLLPSLKMSQAGRIINIASKGLIAYPFLDIEFDNLNGEKKFSVAHAYYHSKLAQIMFTFDLADRLGDTNITVNCIRVPAVQLDEDRFDHIPTFLRGIYRFKMKFSLTSTQMAETYLKLSLSPDYKSVTGAYIDENGKQVKASRKAYNQQTWGKLWDVSEQMTQSTHSLPI